MPFGSHWYDLLPLLILALLLFGAKRLPEMGSAVGKTIKEFQKSMREVTDGSDHAAPAVMPPTAQAPAAIPARTEASTETQNAATTTEQAD